MNFRHQNTPLSVSLYLFLSEDFYHNIYIFSKLYFLLKISRFVFFKGFFVPGFMQHFVFRRNFFMGQNLFENKNEIIMNLASPNVDIFALEMIAN